MKCLYLLSGGSSMPELRAKELCRFLYGDQRIWGQQSPSEVQVQNPGRRSQEQSTPQAEAFRLNRHKILNSMNLIMHLPDDWQVIC